MTKRSLLAAALVGVAMLALPASQAIAQTTPTGIITGHVADPQGGLLPGVLVTASSSSLQGTRTATSSKNGDYIVPFLPAGDYTVTFELAGFTTASLKVRVQLAESVPLDAQLSVGGVSEAVTVTAEAASDFTQGATAAASYKAEQLDKLPVGRDVRGAVLLAPGTTSTGPGGNITFSGAMSFEGLFLMNGVVLNETLRGQGSLVFIEDAIEETKTSTAAISAEYGRFSGGVANIITKSGGNDFSGSFRTTLDSDNWRNLSPFEKTLSEDPRVSTIVPTYEATLGGPILKDKLWFFGAGKMVDNQDSATTVFTNIAYDNVVNDQRAEGKLTYALNSSHTFKGSITKRWRDETNNSFGDVMDRSSFYDSSQPERLLSVNYSGILKPNFFVEAQFSQRKLSFVGSGSRFTDLVQGTMILDRSRGSARWNSPTFCAVCGLSAEDVAAGKLNEERRNNRNIILKGSYFLSTSNLGSHNIVFGGDTFEDSRKNDNYQSGSEFRLLANNTIIRGESLFPVIIPGTSDTNAAGAYLQWNPIFESSSGSQLRTYSAFLNDAWRLSNNWSFNVGVRFDRTDEKDQARNQLAKDQAFSPRLSSSFDVKGDGRFVFNAGFARYVIPVTSGIADLGSGAGRTGSFTYVYRGPAINADLNTPNPVSAADALTRVFAWFNANGGTNRPLRSNPSYPGVNRRLSDAITTPTTWEYSLGFAGKLGSKGSYRVDGVFRDYNDFYTDEILPGRNVADPTGRRFDLAIVQNTNDLERKYKALIVQGQYRATSSVRLGGNYTLSNSYGNFNGETSGSGPVADDFLAYAEYKNESWNTPTGDLSIDQRHKLRVWANFEKSLGGAGRVDIGLLERYSSGSPYSLTLAVDSRPFVTNPGYLSPPSSVTYYAGGRGTQRTDAVSATDLSVNYYLPVKALKRGQAFLRIVVNNMFDQSAQDGAGDTTIFSATNQNTARSLVSFNPFTQVAVAGTHYELGPDYGKAISASDYQAPRSYYVSLAFRF